MLHALNLTLLCCLLTFFISTLAANPTQAFLSFLALIFAAHAFAWMISLSARLRLARWSQRDQKQIN